MHCRLQAGSAATAIAHVAEGDGEAFCTSQQYHTFCICSDQIERGFRALSNLDLRNFEPISTPYSVTAATKRARARGHGGQAAGLRSRRDGGGGGGGGSNLQPVAKLETGGKAAGAAGTGVPGVPKRRLSLSLRATLLTYTSCTPLPSKQLMAH
eukprot:6192824-Pleurochrysis_carterae.AAC.3